MSVDIYLFVCGGSAFAAIITAASSNCSLDSINGFAVTVVVVALGRSVYFLSFPAASQLVRAAYYATDQLPNLSNASTCILPGLGAVRRPASVELAVCISLNFRRSRELKKEMLPVVQYLKEMIPKIHRAANPLSFGLSTQQLVL